MQLIISLLFKGLRNTVFYIERPLVWLFCRIWFYIHNVKCKNFKTDGIPYISVASSVTVYIDEGFIINNRLKGNPIGHHQRCIFVADTGTVLTIKKHMKLAWPGQIIGHITCPVKTGTCPALAGGV